jgi:hypothetical protein
MRTSLRAVGCAALIGAALAGCGHSSPTLDTATIEREVANSILAQHNVRVAVRCPPKVKREAGVAFTCTALLDAGSYPVSVTETNNKGRVRYANPTPFVVLNIEKVEQAIERSVSEQRHLHSRVSCPAAVLQHEGVTFTCTAQVAGQRYPFEVVETDGHGNVRYVGR